MKIINYKGFHIFKIMYSAIAIIFLGVLCAILSLVLLLYFRRNQIVNIYLILAFLTAGFYFTSHGLNHLVFNKYSATFLGFSYYIVIWFFNPIIYLYFNKLEINTKFFKFSDLKHFIIPAFCLLVVIHYHFHLTFLLRKESFALLFIHSSYYNFKSYKILKRSFWNGYKNKDKTSLEGIVTRDWTTLVFYGVILLLVHIFVSATINLFDQSAPIGCSFYLENILTFVGLFIALKMLFSPNLLHGLRTNSKPLKSLSSNFIIKPVWNLDANSDINTKDKVLKTKIRSFIPTYIHQIEQLSLEEQVFRQSNYGLKDLATDLGLPKYYLEYLFKYHCALTFNDYKKLIKIYDSVELIANDYLRTGTLEALSIQVGFASYNPFLINFKDIIGVSPYDFSKNRKIKNHTFITIYTNK